MAGSTVSNNGHVTSNHGSKDYWVVKLAPLELTVPELDNTLMELNAFQNHDQLIIRFFSSKKENAKLNLFDVTGKCVTEKNIPIMKASIIIPLIVLIFQRECTL